MNVEISQKEIAGQEELTITEQLRLFSLSALAINTGIVSKLVEKDIGFSALALISPEGQLSPLITEIDSENRVMLNDLYGQLGADSVSATVQELSSDTDCLLRRVIPAPNGITFVELYSVVGDWSAFVVKACTSNEVVGMHPGL